MKTIRIISILSVVIFAFACSKDDSKSADFKPVQITEKQKQLLTKSNEFGFQFFKVAFEQSETQKNLMISPLSISMALGMTRNGAAGSTNTDMTKTLGFEGMNDAEINESYKYILSTFSALDPKVNINIANSIWYRNTFSVEKEFINTNSDYFNASVTPLDFNNPTAKDIINNWVSEKTNTLIPSIIDEISNESVMFLVNAIYFKGQWKYQFETKNSALAPFYLLDGTSINATSMVQRCTLPYAENSVVRAVELPYNQGNYVMTIAQPMGTNTLADVVAALSDSPNWKFADTDIQIKLPKFKYEYNENNMKSILSQMGMGIAFSPDLADFTRINSAGNLYISDVKHKTFIETNEEGTEAAAVTAVEVGVTSIGNDNPLYFTVDKPFVYFITEKSTGTVLFVGVVYNPTL